MKVPEIPWRSHLSVVFHNEIGDLIVEQESCAIAKMSADCALYMGALKIFENP